MAEIKFVRAEKKSVPNEDEAEAKLHKEGYESFRWYDVPGAKYPKHRHENDECIWVLKGEITFTVEEKDYPLKPGDRIYLPANTTHTVKVHLTGGATYLVGQKN